MPCELLVYHAHTHPFLHCAFSAHPAHPACIALVKAMRLLYGLRLRSLCTGGRACTGGNAGRSSKRFLTGSSCPPFLASYGLRDRRVAAALRFEYGLGLRLPLPRYGGGDLEGTRFAGGEAPRLPLAPFAGLRSSGVLDRDLDIEKRRADRFLSLLALLLRDLTLPLILRGAWPRAFSCGDCMRADRDLDLLLVLLRPLSPGLKELIRRRVFLS